MPQKEGMAKVKEYARRALAADDSSAEAHASIAVALFFGDWDWSGAEKNARQAIQLNTGYSTAHLVYSVILAASGRVNEAIEQDHLAMDLDPLSLIVNWNAAGTLFYARRYEDAIAQCKRASELEPSSHLGPGALAHVYEQTGNYQGVMDILDKLPAAMTGGKGVVSKLKHAYATAGPTGYWRAMLELESGPGGSKLKDQIRLAVVYTKLGEREKALAALEHAFAVHAGDMVFINIEPCFDPLHAEPRFQSLVRRVGLTPGA